MSSQEDRPEFAPNDIAIVGMAGRFPGCPSVQEYWRRLRAGEECIRPLSDAELAAAGVPPALLTHPQYVKAGGPLEDVECFDAGFFGLSPKDAAIMDPQHRHFYECAWSALEDAGHPPARFSGAIGVFAGCGMNAYFVNNVLTNPDLVQSVGLFLLRHTGNDRDFLPTGVSYRLDLRGPSVAIQTACSTSLVAIHMACQSLLAGECDLALAGGVTIQVPHRQGYLFRENEILSPDGHCRAFDERAAGTVITNGVGVVALRRLEDAWADGDFVHAVLKATAINNDGSSKVGYLAPSVDGHAAVVAEALALAGLSADDISYLETHGTGTAVGDPIEIAALTAAFRRSTQRARFCPIGSVKASIGHLDTAAGVAGVIKVALALRQREIPPSLNFTRPNPRIDFESSPFFVNTRLRDWPAERGPRRAGVSSLGVGGTNAHAILEEAPAPRPTDPGAPYPLLCLSAKTPAALEAATENLARHLEQHPGLELADVAYTLQVGREAFAQRRVLAARDLADAVGALRARDPKRLVSAQATKDPARVVFLFPGGGTQYPNMGRELYEREPVYRAALDECLTLLRPRLQFDLRALMFPAPGDEERAAQELRRARASIAAIFSVEYATARLWMSWGVEPVAMTGHSLGEYAAACLAGVLELDAALGIVVLRGELLEGLGDSGMLSVPLSEAELQPLLGERLDLAAVNGPELCLVSGRSEDLEPLERTLAAREVECRRLHIAGASHCRLLDPVLDRFRAGLARVRFQPPTRPYVSNVTGTWVRPEDATDPESWVRHFRHCVRFSKGLATLLADGERIFLEVGPGQALTSLARQQPTKPRAALSSLRHPAEETSDLAFLRTALGRLWAAGAEIDWERVHGGARRNRVPLPTYPFERQRYWIEPGRAALAAPTAPTVLRRHASVEDWFARPIWTRVPTPPRHEAELAGGWLVFLDQAGVGSRVVDLLRAAGHRVRTVREGDSFYRFGADEYALTPEEGRAGYDQLLEALAAEGPLPERIVHLWLVTSQESFRAGSSFFHRNQERGFYSLLFLAQALGEAEPARGTQLTVVSNGMQRVGSEPLPHPDKATVLGPVRVIPRELPGVTCASVDLPILGDGPGAEPDLEGLAQGLFVELLAAPGNGVYAQRGGARHALALEPVHLARSGAAPLTLRERGVYLVTGGLGGIGLAVARHLARTRRARLVLLGRRGLPPRADWPRELARAGARDPVRQAIGAVRELEELGAEVLVAAADVADVVAMRRVLDQTRERFGALHGVIHAAGTLDDGVLQTRTPEEVEEVFTPKVYGTLLLADLLRGSELDFLALCSSTSALLGPAGQVDYTAANCFLNAFAESAAARADLPPTVAIDWGVWKETGVGARSVRRLQGRTDELAGRREPGRHPLLAERVLEADGSVVHETELDPAVHWVLDEHRSAEGRALLPGTAYLELLVGCVGERLGRARIEIDSLDFLEPLEVPDGESRSLRVHVTGPEPRFEVEVRSRVGGTWRTHAQARLSLGEAAAPGRLDLSALEARCPRGVPTAELVGQGGALRFGPRWQVLREVRLGTREGLARLELPAAFRSDLESFALHPGLLDLATGFGLALIGGYEPGAHLWVPLSYAGVAVHGPLPSRIVSHVRSAEGNDVARDLAEFDLTLADEQGRVLLEVRRLVFKRLARSQALGAGLPPASAAAGLEHASAAEKLFLETFEAGIRTAEGTAALERILTSDPQPVLYVSPLSLAELATRMDEASAPEERGEVRFERPQLASTYEAPRDELERTLAEYWEDLLGVERIGIHDDFFELGGHSLIAVRLFARIKKTYHVEFPLSVLFEGPTLARCAELLRAELGVSLGEAAAGPKEPAPRRRYLVPMRRIEGPARPPFFLVSGMFGNVLNLRHLAAHLGPEQPVYALQAKGLLGDDKPHTRFEDMARDYLAEVRAVQAAGPYFLGGFSGGGITALEMARQLREQGERVELVVLLDSIPTRMPGLTLFDRLGIQWIHLRREGPRYLADWLRRRRAWKQGLDRPHARELTPAEFRSEEIEAAFREAIDHHEPRAYDGRVLLLRPPLPDTYVLRPGRVVNHERLLVDPSNHWTAYLPALEVREVPGNHDSMVLEPHVRVLAKELRAALEAAQRRALGSATPDPEPITPRHGDLTPVH